MWRPHSTSDVQQVCWFLRTLRGLLSVIHSPCAHPSQQLPCVHVFACCQYFCFHLYTVSLTVCPPYNFPSFRTSGGETAPSRSAVTVCKGHGNSYNYIVQQMSKSFLRKYFLKSEDRHILNSERQQNINTNIILYIT